MFDSIAIVGATGAVGHLIRNMLEERDFPFEQIKFLASARSAGKTIEFAGKKHTVEELKPEAFDGIDLAIGSTPDAVAKDFVPWAVERGCVVVDESGYWRMDPKVPLVIPEVNPGRRPKPPGHHRQPELLDHANGRRHEAAARRRPRPPRRRQHLSGHQRRGRRRPAAIWKTAAGPRSTAKNYKYETFAHPIAFNLHSADRLAQAQGLHLGRNEDGVRDAQDPGRRLDSGLPDVRPRAGQQLPQREHSGRDRAEDHASTRPASCSPPSRASRSIDDLANGKYPMPSDCDGDDAVFIGRIREDLSCDNGLAFWCVSDNLRKGAATNAVQIAELLVRTQAAVSTNRHNDTSTIAN